MRLLHGDCLEVLKQLNDNTIHSVITDPPYGLAFMNKRWDHDVPSVDVWREVLRVLRPGGHLLSFGGTRTYHRLVVNIEDAGFEIRDQIQWIYGSGFPKSHNIGKAIDKAAGAEREIVGIAGRSGQKRNSMAGDFAGEYMQTNPATEFAKQWDGWGTALKPANEPICLARKTLEGTVADNIGKWGVGGLNIDGCRIEGKKPEMIRTSTMVAPNAMQGKSTGATSTGKMSNEGRWPANLMFDEFAAEQLGEPSRFFYVAKASKRERGTGNNHPTVKPIKLMKYLCKLITPPNGIVLDPFMGSGSTGLAAINLGFDFIGIEKELEYLEIATKRIENGQ